MGICFGWRGAGIPSEVSYRIADGLPILACDSSISPRQAVEDWCHRLDQEQDTLFPVFGWTVLSALRSAVAPLLTTFPPLFIEGVQGTGKTTLARRYSLLWNAEEGFLLGNLDASSTSVAVQQSISQFKDQTVLLDDMAISSSAPEGRNRRDVMSSALRFTSNLSVRERASGGSRNNQLSCQAGLVLTGEIHLSTASDLSRSVLVELPKPFRSGSPDDRKLVATVLHYLLCWVLPQLDKYLEDLRVTLRNLGDVETRLETTHTLLTWSLQMFLDFSMSVGAIDCHFEQETIEIM